MKTLSFRHAVSPTALVLSLTLAAAPALAADTAEAADDTAQAAQVEDDLHNRQTARDGTIIVSAAGVREFDLLAGTSVLEVRDIQRDAVNRPDRRSA
jgi:iron complex outermembrane recepter protein